MSDERDVEVRTIRQRRLLVEVAFLGDGDVAPRDTKDRTLAPHCYSAREWAAFVAGVRAGELDTP